MLNHRGFNAWIQAGGEQLPEYCVSVDEDLHRVSSWIPGKEGESFTVYWEDQGGGVDTCSFIYLDGFPISGRFLRGTGITSKGGIRTSENTERPFMFQKALDEALEEPYTASIFEETGTIILKVKRCIIIETEDQPANPIQSIPSDSGKKKVGDMRIGFGLEVLAAEQLPQTYKVVSFEDPEQPLPSTYVTFVFNYRSPEFLVAQGIATVGELSPKRSGKRKRSAEPRRTASQSRARHPAAEEEEESSPFAVSPKEEVPKKFKKREVGTTSIGSHAPPTEMQPPVAKRRRTATSNMGPPPSHAESSTSRQIQFFLPAPRSSRMPPGLPTLDSLRMGSPQTSTVNSPVAIEQAEPQGDQTRHSVPNYPWPQPPWPQNALSPNASPQNALPQSAHPPNPVPVQHPFSLHPMLPPYMMRSYPVVARHSQPQTTLPAQLPVAQTSVVSTPAPVAPNPAITFTAGRPSVQALIAHAARAAREAEEANTRTQASHMAIGHTLTRTPVERIKTPSGFSLEDYLNMGDFH